MKPRCLISMVVVGSAMGLNVVPPLAADPTRTILYFMRHSENQTKLNGTGPGTFVEECNPTRSCCTVVLSPLGLERRDALAGWFVEEKLARRLTHLIATNKPRTVQTLLGLADRTGLAVEQAPPDTGECADGFETTTGSKPFAVAAVRDLPLGSRAVVANHSETLYAVMRESVGLDTSDPVVFPKQPGSADRVDGFTHLWVVEADAAGQGSLRRHIVFAFQLEGDAHGRRRARVVGH